MARVFHLLNPSAPRREGVRRLLRRTPPSAPLAWVSREHPEHTETLLDWALQEGIGRLVVWGGDGTFHRVVNGLWRRRALERMELALVPAGTCNDLARRLKLTQGLWRRWESPAPEGRLAALALWRLLWKPRQTDKLDPDTSERLFVNNAGFGRPRSAHEARRGPLGVLRAFQPISVRTVWPQGEVSGSYYMMLACSAPYFSGGLHFEADLSPEEGILRFYFVPAASKGRLALRLLRGRLGGALFDDKITKITAREADMETDAPVWPQADGEPPPKEGVRFLRFERAVVSLKMWCAA